MPAHIAGVMHAVPAPVWLPHPTDVNELMPSLWSANTVKDASGALVVAGVPVTTIAAEYGTPVFVMDVADFKGRARDFVDSFGEAFAAVGTKARAYYAGKAFLCTAAARWAAEAGMGIDTCSLGELRIARAAGIDPALIGLHGNNKSDAELELALEMGIGRIIVDSLAEIARIESLAAARGVTAPVMIRVTVGVEAHTHDFIATAHEDQKFGLSLSGGAAFEAAEAVVAAPHLRLLGLHSHIGSQIFEKDGFEVAAKRIIGLSARIRTELGTEVPEIDLGGGFGIRYTSQDTPESFATLAAQLAEAVVHAAAEHGVGLPEVSFEPGRAIVGPSMFSLYEVGTVKPVDTGAGIRHYVSVDGGMSDNVRTALYDADYSCTLANRASGAEPFIVRVVGKHCESGDVLVRDEYLPSDVAAGDLVAVPGTGAYCRELASNYNHLPRPGVLAVEDGEADWIVLPETYDHLLATDPGYARP